MINRENLRIKSYNPWWCSHIPMLIKYMNLSKGPVLELGIGAFSTPLLHMLCLDQGRQLRSYEDNLKWIKGHYSFVKDFHSITYVENWDDVPIEDVSWGLVFVDHIADRRAIDAIRAKEADYVIIHDSNARYEPGYHYSLVYPHFKYRYIYDKAHPHTTVLSNKHKL